MLLLIVTGKSEGPSRDMDLAYTVPKHMGLKLNSMLIDIGGYIHPVTIAGPDQQVAVSLVAHARKVTEHCSLIFDLYFALRPLSWEMINEAH